MFQAKTPAARPPHPRRIFGVDATCFRHVLFARPVSGSAGQVLLAPACSRAVVSIATVSGPFDLQPACGVCFRRRGAQVSFEIERKFLVSGDAWRELARKRISIRQAYLTSEETASVRIRIKNENVATLTIKSRPVDLRRLELEYPIPVVEAEALIQLRQGSVIQKVRHIVPWHDVTWEVDVFSGDNLGLIIAEVELRHEHQPIDLPEWIGREVTGQRQYYNSFLIGRPFRSWASAADESVRRDGRA
ncbi:MAG TPA: CYTH domain-containing protein [Nitrolancea sp.]|nr:CYTH domain-containing protein [Nitrolancea sp.]